jgi:hypothetical protein
MNKPESQMGKIFNVNTSKVDTSILSFPDVQRIVEARSDVQEL